MVDIQLFKTFQVVTQLNNVTQAAEQLNFTQPAVTAQIRTLEEHYGVILFERIGKKLYITEAGRELALHAEKLLAAYQEVNTAMQRFSELQTALRVGASTTTASYILSPVLLELQKQGVDSQIIVNICPDLPATTKGLLDNSFDIAIAHSKINHNQIVQFALYNERQVWVVKRELMEAHQHSEDPREYPFINLRRSGMSKLIVEEIVKEKEIRPLLEYNDAEALKRAVLEGVGAGILPYVLVKPFLADGTLVKFADDPRLSFIISVAFRKGKELRPAMRAFLASLAQQAHIENDLLTYLAAGS